MSKLKAGVIVTPHNEGMSFSRGSDHVSVTEGETEFYLKSEVDKVIARSKEKLVEQTTLRVWAELQLRHNKYKRCLAMAEMCGVEYDRWLMKKANAIRLGKDGVEYFLRARKKVFHYMRWQPRWLKLAEKCKEAK